MARHEVGSVTADWGTYPTTGASATIAKASDAFGSFRSPRRKPDLRAPGARARAGGCFCRIGSEFFAPEAFRNVSEAPRRLRKLTWVEGSARFAPRALGDDNAAAGFL